MEKTIMQTVESKDLLAVEGGLSLGAATNVLSSIRQRISEVRTNTATVSDNAFVGNNNSINVVQG